MKLKTVLLEITDKCNLNCRHCMNRPDEIGIETSVEQIDKLLVKFEKYETEKVFISGGEPLVHKSICEIINLCSKYPLISFVITTNGLLLSNEIIMLAEKIPNLLFQFSIDGISSNSFDAIRGNGSYDLFQKKITLWKSLSIKRALGRTCLNKYNYKELPLIYKFCVDHNIFPSFLFISMLGNGLKNWSELELNLGEKIWCINEINRLNNEFGLNITPPEAPASCNFTEGAGVSSLLIRADGRVAPCQYFYNESIGNIFEDEICDILNNPWIENIKKIAEQRKETLKLSEQCQNCKIKEGCNYGCIGMANDMGNIMLYDGLCSLRIMTTLCYSNRLIIMNQTAIKSNSIKALDINDNN